MEQIDSQEPQLYIEVLIVLLILIFTFFLWIWIRECLNDHTLVEMTMEDLVWGTNLN